MFPNPQSALPLPPRPNLERYKKLAKDLVNACNSSSERAIGDWAEQWVGTLAKLAGDKNARQALAHLRQSVDGVEEFARRKLSHTNAGNDRCHLADAQFVIARSHGFESWPKFASHLEALARKNSSIARFEGAAEAIVSGDVVTLKQLLREDPNLIRMRSTREHRATLLHYVSANGVEGYRQKTPVNAVKIAEILLEAGAEVDAEANVYGGGATTQGLVATSVHPEQVGVQEDLMQLLLDHGAAMDHPRGSGNNDSAVMECLANGRGKAAEFLANRGAILNLESAAGVGRLDMVKSFFNEQGSLKPNATKAQMEGGFVWACMYGRTNVVEFLLEKGVDLAGQAHTGQTGLHAAAIGGQLDIIKLLVKRNAPLEVRNEYGGTVLDQATWCVMHGDRSIDYLPIIEILLDTGAKIEEADYPTGNERIDKLLGRHRAKL